ncbi:MAG TPA: C39 family peptidase [Anaerolineales bacterium]|nr:C39 family peptidase [Anaerolineales bacterium]
MLKKAIGAWKPLAVLALIIAVYFFPGAHDRINNRLDDFRQQVKYAVNPPQNAVFLPTQQAAIDAIVSATMQAHALAQTPSATPNAPSTGSASSPKSTPAPKPTALPATVTLPGVKYVDQFDRWNYCAPSNLTMALNFWGWKGNRDDVAKIVKPGENDASKNFIDRGKSDKNVMPYELVDFVNNETEYQALYRYGGDAQLFKTMLANGFPMMAEKGIYENDTTNRQSWMGHYQFVTGYDDVSQTFLVQDTYLKGPNYHVPYSDFVEGWRAFDRVFIVVYPADRQDEVMSLLGSYTDPKWSAQHALDVTDQEIKGLSAAPLFFAWFAKGTSLVALQQYVDAANAYDKAFSVYATLDPNYSTRPWRMMWYQTGPYWAYYYSGRYQDVIDLANYTLDKTTGTPTLEESLYWRGLAEYAIGNTSAGLGDVQRAAYYNKYFQAAIAKLQEWGQ